MARASDQFRQSDVTFWGIVALVCGGVALLGANISALVPESAFAALHATRLSGASASEMHTELGSLSDEQAQLRASNSQLAARFDLAERNATAIRQRLGALEISVPTLTEAMNTRANANVDTSVITGSIGPAPGITKDTSYPVDGGSVKVTQTPLIPVPAVAATMPQVAPAQPEPASLTASSPATSVATTPSTAKPDAPDQTAAAPGATGISSMTNSTVGPVATASISPTPTAIAVTDAVAASQPMPARLVPPISAPTTNQPAVAISAPPLTVAGPLTSPPVPATHVATSGVQPSPVSRPDVIAEGAITGSADVGPAGGPVASAAATPTKAVASAPVPAPTGNVTSIGVAIGAPVQPANALPAWQSLAARVGILLVGTSPLLAEDPAGGGGKVLVAGPLTDIPAATKLCSQISQAGLTCMPMPYVGLPLAPAASATQ